MPFLCVRMLISVQSGRSGYTPPTFFLTIAALFFMSPFSTTVNYDRTGTAGITRRHPLFFVSILINLAFTVKKCEIFTIVIHIDTIIRKPH